MKLINYLCLLCASVVTVSCLERSFAEEDPILTTRSGDIVVPSDAYAGRNLVRDTLYVYSNRTWTAALVEEVDWMTMDVKGHHELSQIHDAIPIPLAFQDNETDEDRTAVVHISCADGDKDITITQQAIAYRLVITSSLAKFEDVHYEGATVRLAFNTNTTWTVKTKDGSDFAMKFSTNAEEVNPTATLSGKYTSRIDVVIPENDELIAKSATIVLSAKGCEDIEIPVTQIKGVPYLRFTEVPDGQLIADPGRPNDTIKVKTNSNWAAEILSVEGYGASEVKLAKTSGAAGTQNIVLTYPYCIDFGNTGTIVVRFTVDGIEEPIDYTVTQRPCIRIMWYDYKNNKLLGATKSTYPFTTPPLSDIKTSQGSVPAKLKKKEIPFVTVRGGFTFTIYSTNGIWRNSSWGLSFGNAKNDYMILPAIEGRRLCAITYGCGGKLVNQAVNLQLVGPDGADVPGAIVKTAKSSTPVVFELELENTVVGGAYRFVNRGTGNFSIGDLILYYE